jgi:hypothetical protein
MEHVLIFVIFVTATSTFAVLRPPERMAAPARRLTRALRVPPPMPPAAAFNASF